MKIKTISDEEILQLILDGRLVVKYLNRRNPIIFKDGKAYTATIVLGSRSSNCPRYRICLELPKKKRSRKRRKRSIVRSKLVWMFVEKRCVPYGHELHHKDEDRLNDRSKNIINWSEQDHRDYHNDVPF